MSLFSHHSHLSVLSFFLLFGFVLLFPSSHSLSFLLSDLFEALQAKEVNWFKKLLTKSDLDINAALADDKEKVSKTVFRISFLSFAFCFLFSGVS
jgi:hypothetical protein